MTISTAQRDALDYIETLTNKPSAVAYPNRSKKAVVPRWEIMEGPVTQQVGTLGGQVDASLILQIDVVTEEGKGSADQRTLVQMAVDAFPVLRNFGGCQVTQPPQVGGYRKDEDGSYRASVTVTYRKLRVSG